MIHVIISFIREITSIALACDGKIKNVEIDYFPRRSKIRIEVVIPTMKALTIIDSATISLFSDILK